MGGRRRLGVQRCNTFFCRARGTTLLYEALVALLNLILDVCFKDGLIIYIAELQESTLIRLSLPKGHLICPPLVTLKAKGKLLFGLRLGLGLGLRLGLGLGLGLRLGLRLRLRLGLRLRLIIKIKHSRQPHLKLLLSLTRAELSFGEV
jgi:hypothetical protein